jgi:hypothetical protein
MTRLGERSEMLKRGRVKISRNGSAFREKGGDWRRDEFDERGDLRQNPP